MEGVVLVTGGTRGIGFGIAQALAAKGYNLILGYNSNRKAAEKSRATLLSRHPYITVVTVEGNSYHIDKTIDAYLEIIRTKFQNKLIGVVQNAGGYPGVSTGSALNSSIRPMSPGQLESDSDYQWIDYYIKTYGLFFMKLLEKCAPLMEWRKNRGGGRFLFISSPGCNANSTANPGYLAPGSGKSFGEYLVRQYAKQYAEKQITVNCIIPGIIKTDAWVSYKMPGDKEDETDPEKLTAFKMITKKTPMQRFAEPIEVGHLASYIMSKEALFMTGGVHTANSNSYGFDGRDKQ